MPTMTPLPLEFQDLLKSLNDHGVAYLVVGGWAVIHYGYVRYTGDFDFWIAVSRVNSERLSRAIKVFSGSAFDIDTILLHGKTLEIGNPPLRVQILCDISGVEYDQCEKGAQQAD